MSNTHAGKQGSSQSQNIQEHRGGGRHHKRRSKNESLIYLPARPKQKRDRTFDSRERKGAHIEDLSSIPAILELDMELHQLDEDDFEHYDAYQQSRFYTYGTYIRVEEDREHEFKSAAHSVDPTASVNKHLAKYVNAFLNTNGGTLYFGVEDDGRISGIELPRHDRDKIRLNVDSVVSTFKPQVDSKLYTVKFVPVKNFTNFFVVEVYVHSGVEPVYFTASGDAWIRRDGGCSRLEWTAIKQRLRQERNRDEAVVASWTLTLPEDFLGRQQEIRELRAFVSSGPSEGTAVLVVGIYGPPCVGKSSFSHRLAYEFSSLYRDGAFHIDLSDKKNGYLSERESMVSIIRVRYPEKVLSWNLANVRAMYNSCFDNQSTILLIENAGGQEMIEPLIPHVGRGRCLVLITSRKNLALDLVSEHPGRLNAHSVRLDPLSKEDGRAILSKYSDDIPLEVADQLLDRCGGLPIVIRWLGNTLRKRPNLTPAKLLERLENEDKRLQPVQAHLNMYFDLMSKSIADHLRAISVFPTTFEVSAAASVLGMDLDSTLDALGDLLEECLLNYDVMTQRYTQNDLVRLYAAKESKKTLEDHLKFKRRFVEYYYSILRLANGLYMAGVRRKAACDGSIAEHTTSTGPSPISASPLQSSPLESPAMNIVTLAASHASWNSHRAPALEELHGEDVGTDGGTDDDDSSPHASLPRSSSMFSIVDLTSRDNITTPDECDASSLLFKLERANIKAALHHAIRLRLRGTSWRMASWLLLFERRVAMSSTPRSQPATPSLAATTAMSELRV